MKKDLHFKDSILKGDVICEHKLDNISFSSTVSLHNHDGYEIYLFLSGEDASYFVESDEKALERGDLILINAYTFHGLRIPEVTRYERVVINIREPYLQSLSDPQADLSLCFHRVPSKRLNTIRLNEAELERYLSIADDLEKVLSAQDYGHTVLARAYLSELMVMINQYAETFHTPRYSNIMPSIVTKTFDYIEENITSDITIKNLAEQFHHNGDYLSRVFKEATGSSLKHFINAKKISLAQQYLGQGYPPQDVCFMIGYKNYSSFSRRFSEEVGLSPKQYQLDSRSEQLGGRSGQVPPAPL